jgi:hypothetical protein
MLVSEVQYKNYKPPSLSYQLAAGFNPDFAIEIYYVKKILQIQAFALFFCPHQSSLCFRPKNLLKPPSLLPFFGSLRFQLQNPGLMSILPKN